MPVALAQETQAVLCSRHLARRPRNGSAPMAPAFHPAQAFGPEALSLFAHDVRGPLANLALIIEAVESRNHSIGDEKIQIWAEKAFRQIERLEEMVRKMLARARTNDGAEAQTSSNELSLVDLREVANSVATLNQPLAQRHDVRIRCSLQKQAIVYGDADLLMRAIDNLVTNAIKFSPRGGKVACRISVVSNAAVFQVEDEGPGLTEDDIERAFRPFERLSAKSNSPMGSNGLGLSIARRIAEQHGGRVTAANRRNARGALFTMRLPLCQPA